MIPVSELRQYHFCPKVVYFHSLGIEEAEKEYMRAGRENQEVFQSREERRATLAGLRKLRVDERIFGMRLASLRLCLEGVADLVLRMGDEWAVAELKGGRKPSSVPLGHRVQVGAYSLLLEEKLSKLVRRAFIIYDDGFHEIQIDENLRRHVLWTLGKVMEIYRGRIPSVEMQERCSSCGYSIHCSG